MNTLKKSNTSADKKTVAYALAGILAAGAFTATPAFAGSHGNGCSAAGCGAKKEAHSCSGKSGCNDKHSCKANSCADKHACKGSAAKDKNSCSGNSCSGKSSCAGKDNHNDNSRYND